MTRSNWPSAMTNRLAEHPSWCAVGLTRYEGNDGGLALRQRKDTTFFGRHPHCSPECFNQQKREKNVTMEQARKRDRALISPGSAIVIWSVSAAHQCPDCRLDCAGNIEKGQEDCFSGSEQGSDASVQVMIQDRYCVCKSRTGACPGISLASPNLQVDVQPRPPKLSHTVSPLIPRYLEPSTPHALQKLHLKLSITNHPLPSRILLSSRLNSFSR